MLWSRLIDFLTLLSLCFLCGPSQAIILKGSRILGCDPQQVILASLKLPASLISPPPAPDSSGLPPYSSLSPLTRFCSQASHVRLSCIASGIKSWSCSSCGMLIHGRTLRRSKRIHGSIQAVPEPHPLSFLTHSGALSISLSSGASARGPAT